MFLFPEDGGMLTKIERVDELDTNLKNLQTEVINQKLKGMYDKENKSYVFSVGNENKFMIKEENITKLGVEFQKQLVENYRNNLVADIQESRKKSQAILLDKYGTPKAEKARKDVDEKFKNAKTIDDLNKVKIEAMKNSEDALNGVLAKFGLTDEQMSQLKELNNQNKLQFENRKKEIIPHLEFIKEYTDLRLDQQQQTSDAVVEGATTTAGAQTDLADVQGEVELNVEELKTRAKELKKRYKRLEEIRDDYDAGFLGVKALGRRVVDGIKMNPILKTNKEIIRLALQNQKFYTLNPILKILKLHDDSVYSTSDIYKTLPEDQYTLKQGTLKDAKEGLDYSEKQLDKIEARLTNIDLMTQTLFKLRVNKNWNEKDENLPNQDRNYDFDFGTNDQKQMDKLNKILTKVIEENKARIAKKFNIELKRLNAEDAQKFANYLDDGIDGRIEPEKFKNIKGLDNDFLDNYKNYYTLVQQAKNVFCYPGFVDQKTPEYTLESRFTQNDKDKKDGDKGNTSGNQSGDGNGTPEVAPSKTGVPFLDAVVDKGLVRGSIEQGVDAIVKALGYKNDTAEFTQLKSAAGWLGAGAFAFFAGRAIYRRMTTVYNEKGEATGKKSFPWFKAIGIVAGAEIGSRMLFKTSALGAVGGLMFGKEVGGDSTSKLIDWGTNLGLGFQSTKTETSSDSSSGSGEKKDDTKKGSDSSKSTKTDVADTTKKVEDSEVIDQKVYENKVLTVIGNLDRKTLQDKELLKEENGVVTLNITNLQTYYKDSNLSVDDKQKVQEYLSDLDTHGNDKYESSILEDAGVKSLADLDVDPDRTVSKSVVDSVTKNVEEINDEVKSAECKYKDLDSRQRIVDDYRKPSNKEKDIDDLIKNWKTNGRLVSEDSQGGIEPENYMTDIKNEEGKNHTVDLFHTLTMSDIKNYITDYDSDGKVKEIDIEKIRKLEKYADFKKYYYSTEQRETIIQALNDLLITESFINNNADKKIDEVGEDLEKKQIVTEFEKENHYKEKEDSDLKNSLETTIKNSSKADLKDKLIALSKLEEAKNPFDFDHTKSNWFTNIASWDGKNDDLGVEASLLSGKGKTLTLNQRKILTGMSNALSDKIIDDKGQKFELDLDVINEKGDVSLKLNKNMLSSMPENLKNTLSKKEVVFNVNTKTIAGFNDDAGKPIAFDHIEDLMMSGYHALGLMCTLAGTSEIEDNEYFDTRYFNNGLAFQKKDFVGSVKDYWTNMSRDEKTVYLASWAVLPIAPYMGVAGATLATSTSVFAYGYLGMYGPNFMDFYHGKSSFTSEGKYQALQKMSEGDNMKSYAKYLNNFGSSVRQKNGSIKNPNQQNSNNENGGGDSENKKEKIKPENLTAILTTVDTFALAETSKIKLKEAITKIMSESEEDFTSRDFKVEKVGTDYVVKSYGKETKIKFDADGNGTIDGFYGKTKESYDGTKFSDMTELLKVANITNNIKYNYTSEKVSDENNKPFFADESDLKFHGYDEDSDADEKNVISGGYIRGTVKNETGNLSKVLEKNLGDYAKYLNTLGIWENYEKVEKGKGNDEKKKNKNKDKDDSSDRWSGIVKFFKGTDEEIKKLVEKIKGKPGEEIYKKLIELNISADESAKILQALTTTGMIKGITDVNKQILNENGEDSIIIKTEKNGKTEMTKVNVISKTISGYQSNGEEIQDVEFGSYEELFRIADLTNIMRIDYKEKNTDVDISAVSLEPFSFNTDTSIINFYYTKTNPRECQNFMSEINKEDLYPTLKGDDENLGYYVEYLNKMTEVEGSGFYWSKHAKGKIKNSEIADKIGEMKKAEGEVKKAFEDPKMLSEIDKKLIIRRSTEEYCNKVSGTDEITYQVKSDGGIVFENTKGGIKSELVFDEEKGCYKMKPLSKDGEAIDLMGVTDKSSGFENGWFYLNATEKDKMKPSIEAIILLNTAIEAGDGKVGSDDSDRFDIGMARNGAFYFDGKGGHDVDILDDDPDDVFDALKPNTRGNNFVKYLNKLVEKNVIRRIEE